MVMMISSDQMKCSRSYLSENITAHCEQRISLYNWD